MYSLNSSKILTLPSSTPTFHGKHIWFERLNRAFTVLRATDAQDPQTLTYDHWYSPTCPPLKRYVGRVEVKVLEGKGRGVVATQDLAQGDLIMVSEPLAILRDPDGQRPDGEALVDAILEQGTHKNRWFEEFLYDGTPKSTKSIPDFREGSDHYAESPGPADTSTTSSSEQSSDVDPSSVPETVTKKSGVQSVLKRLSKQGKSGAGFGVKTSTIKIKSGTSSGGDDVMKGVDRATAKRVAKIVKFNCFGDAHDDRAAASCRQETATSHIGVWPEMSMLNHSCAPNAINYVLGNSIVIRAAGSIKAGDEVTISYLGRPQLVPVEMRIETLREDYGFTCECERCTAELVHMDKVQGHYEELYSRVAEDLGPLFNRALKSKDVEGIMAVRDELRNATSNLFSSFRKSFLQPQTRLFYTASMYDVLELHMECEDAFMAISKEQHGTMASLHSDKALSHAVVEEISGEASVGNRHAGSKTQETRTSTSTAPVLSDLAIVQEETTATAIIDHALMQALKSIQEVSPGSDLHVILASKYFKRMQLESQGGNDDHSTFLQDLKRKRMDASLDLAIQAHLCRYGSTSTEMSMKLINLNNRLYENVDAVEGACVLPH
ncbi:hypothetical protein CEUSTIGMA_g2448.t1 [Chlamydomonas eustigma]|uniref:SET domain-containing protein n=1 Tax=Chlamydomonas eustigma TaxID=1157962 RepID=A0A250WWK8_9CHLO|nr:hypothetical protein CEUSTIGMA_g2448.t1 [Chlamydomonas eustigma]|eukprot:GAX75002.1 hypothetical protein CEUSTIGMA_g2448.t1 [Chlamydomonas eustigma]